MEEDLGGQLTSSRLLARNTLWNVLGQGAPLIAGAVAIPILVHNIGLERFGVLTIAWAFVGYFSLFDLGLGRAVTKMVAELLGLKREPEVPRLVWTALAVMAGLGVVGGVIAALFVPVVSRYILKAPAELKGEIEITFYLLCLALPLVTTTAGLRGTLEAYQRFKASSTLRIATGVYTFASPLLVLPFSHSLGPIIGLLVLGRLAGCAAYLELCLRTSPVLRTVSFGRELLRPLLGFGGWITVSNVLSPLMLYADRFMIGAIGSLAAVAYYATPYQLTSQLLLIPTAVVGVLFPAFATTAATDRARALLLFVRGMKYLFLAFFPITLVLVLLAGPLLTLWLGAAFAAESTIVLQLLSVGLLINCLGFVPFVFVQASGRPDLTAKLHTVELPVYLVGMFFLIHAYGVVGAAVAADLRVAFDTAALLVMSIRLARLNSGLVWRMGLVAAGAGVLLGAGFLPMEPVVTGGYLLVTLIAFGALSWFLMLKPSERSYLTVGLRRAAHG